MFATKSCLFVFFVSRDVFGQNNDVCLRDPTLAYPFPSPYRNRKEPTKKTRNSLRSPRTFGERGRSCGTSEHPFHTRGVCYYAKISQTMGGSLDPESPRESESSLRVVVPVKCPYRPGEHGDLLSELLVPLVSPPRPRLVS